MKYNDRTLGQVEAVFNKLGGDDGVRRFLAGELVVREAEQQKQQLLWKIDSVQVDGIERFVVEDYLNEVNIDRNFKQFFGQKVEKSVPVCTIAIHVLQHASRNVSILAELGDRAEISLVHLFELILRQSNGESGRLLVNGCANVAYIRGTDHNFWVVFACWRCGDWYISAVLVENSSKWSVGHQILSYDS